MPDDRPIRGVIFDLDGTLCNTLGDIAYAANIALESVDAPTHPVDDYAEWVGWGLKNLCKAALGEDEGERFERMLEVAVAEYYKFPRERSYPYPGMPELLDEQNDCIQTIHQNGKHLLSILNDVLDLSKVEAGRLSLERIATSPIELLEEVSSLLRKRAEGKNLFFEVLYTPPIPATIVTDPTRLRQILINLIGNAIKFTECGGVRVTASLREPRDGTSRMAFEVMDTGIGMTKDQISRLFKPFVQADNSTTRRFGGTGLGLTICKRLAEMLGGEIYVDSSPDVGSTFTVVVETGSLEGVEMIDDPTLLTVSRSSEAPLGDAAEDPLAGRRILLVEDGPDNQRLISYLLRGWGAEVSVAENGRIGVDMALAAREEGPGFSLILMDMHMPILDGFAATQELRDRGVDTPIVALTAYAMQEDRRRCLAAGCDDFASKPIERERLLKTLIGLTGGSGPACKPVAREEDMPDAVPVDEGPYVSDLADDAEMVEIVSAYVDQLPGRVEAVREAVDRSDVEALGELVHNLKGSAGGYGFGRISEVAAELQEALREGADLGDVADQIDELIDLCERAKARR